MKITFAEIFRAEAIFKKSCKVVLKKILKENGIQDGSHSHNKLLHRVGSYKWLEEAFENAISRNCGKILRAVKVKSSVADAGKNIKQKNKEARKMLSDELRAARNKLRDLQWKIYHADEEAKRVVEEHAREERKKWARRLISARARLKGIYNSSIAESNALADHFKQNIYKIIPGQLYPDIPSPMVIPHRDGLGLPMASAIYFLWVGDIVEYVGQAKKLSNRLRLGSHHILRENHRISFVFVEEKERTWAECYYIGVVKPKLNFGQNGAHFMGSLYQSKEISKGVENDRAGYNL